jgi:hypothetical protein
MKHRTKASLLIGLVSVLATTVVRAQQITVDEFGRGTNGIQALPFTLALDPTGGLPNWNVLIYTLPFAGRQGDVLIHDPNLSGSPIHDVIRFDGTNHLIFYSDSVDGYNAPADTPGPPNPFYANLIHVDEQGSGQFIFADFTPGVNEPGWDASNPSYRFLSEIPEPGAVILLAIGLGVFGLARIRRRLTSRLCAARESAVRA